MPLHPKRLKTRGFNQSALLAGPLASEVKSPLLSDVLIRVRDTGKQAGLTRKERIKNVLSAFDVKKPHKIQSRHILLLDDVITSTATIREASSTLLEAGAKTVSALSLARSTGLAF
jgi:ComF family protein